jgi:hypothetical protein
MGTDEDAANPPDSNNVAHNTVFDPHEFLLNTMGSPKA